MLKYFAAKIAKLIHSKMDKGKGMMK